MTFIHHPYHLHVTKMMYIIGTKMFNVLSLYFKNLIKTLNKNTINHILVGLLLVMDKLRIKKKDIRMTEILSVSCITDLIQDINV